MPLILLCSLSTFSTETPKPTYEMLITKDLHIGGIIKLGYKTGEISGGSEILSQTPPGYVVGMDFGFKPVAYDHYQSGT